MSGDGIEVVFVENCLRNFDLFNLGIGSSLPIVVLSSILRYSFQPFSGSGSHANCVLRSVTTTRISNLLFSKVPDNTDKLIRPT
jgi:hypothetical protein